MRRRVPRNRHLPDGRRGSEKPTVKRRVVVGILASIAWAHESTLAPSGRERWSMSSARETRDECSRYIDLGLTELMRRNADANVKWVGDALWAGCHTLSVTEVPPPLGHYDAW